MRTCDIRPQQDKLLRLWCHEESRVFRDRLISAEDRSWFNDALQVLSKPERKRVLSSESLAALEARNRALTVLTTRTSGNRVTTSDLAVNVVISRLVSYL